MPKPQPSLQDQKQLCFNSKLGLDFSWIAKATFRSLFSQLAFGLFKDLNYSVFIISPAVTSRCNWPAKRIKFCHYVANRLRFLAKVKTQRLPTTRAMFFQCSSQEHWNDKHCSLKNRSNYPEYYPESGRKSRKKGGLESQFIIATLAKS